MLDSISEAGSRRVKGSTRKPRFDERGLLGLFDHFLVIHYFHGERRQSDCYCLVGAIATSMLLMAAMIRKKKKLILR